MVSEKDCIQQKSAKLDFAGSTNQDLLKSKISEHATKGCIFCKIVKGEIPSNKIYEDNEFLAFLDIAPVNPGHALVIPKLHCKNLLDFPKAEETDLLEFIKKVAKAVVKATKAEGFNLGMNNGRVAGQLVDHAHFHIIPRFSGDGCKHWPKKDYKEGEMEEVMKKIKNFL
ncbi:HIT family protein [Candidatus Woesearchaeota archaeon]|nr:HIT family protein [Candidatus Woesearchaeota archaeon]